MQTTTVTTTPAPRMTLDDLALKRFDELEVLYRAGKVPASLRALDGALTGRMLALRGLDRGPISRLLRRFAASRAFVWGGKSFEAKTDRAGNGINRIQLRGVLGKQKLFPFETRFDESAIDGKETVVLDYDASENPLYVRMIHDEIREVAPGLFLGPAMWKTRQGKKTIVWFALDTGKR